jgi:hypothetical protein
MLEMMSFFIDTIFAQISLVEKQNNLDLDHIKENSTLEIKHNPSIIDMISESFQSSIFAKKKLFIKEDETGNQISMVE